MVFVPVSRKELFSNPVDLKNLLAKYKKYDGSGKFTKLICLRYLEGLSDVTEELANILCKSIGGTPHASYKDFCDNFEAAFTPIKLAGRIEFTKDEEKILSNYRFEWRYFD